MGAARGATKTGRRGKGPEDCRRIDAETHWRRLEPFAKRPPGPAPVAQLDRALPSEGKGHRFESCRVRQLPRISLSTRRLASHGAELRPVGHRRKRSFNAAPE
jgi:hypothetical protein